MKILDLYIPGGPNYWSIKHKVVVLKLDLEQYEELPTNEIEGFHDRIQNKLPGLYQHFCSEDKPGGFFDRVKMGTWMGHVVEHIALELQSMAGMHCGFGKTRGAGEKGVYNVVFEFELERAGAYAAHAAVRIAEALCSGADYALEKDIEMLRKIAREDGLGPSTAVIIQAAANRGIPHLRLDNGSIVQLGYGSAQKRIKATITNQTSPIAVDLASDKHKTKQMLQFASVPVPQGMVIEDVNQLEEVVSSIGFPLVAKPFDGNHGNGVTLNIQNREQAKAAFDCAVTFSEKVIFEKYLTGHDYRLLVINYKLVAAAKRTPAMVVGDGISTVKELVEQENLNPCRGEDHENTLTRIRIDKATEALLQLQKLSADSVPAKGIDVVLKQTANLSTGGTSEDVTDVLHPEVVEIAERVARVIGLDICGIDVIAKDITRAIKKDEFAVIEVNAAPGFRMHTNPVIGKPRPVGEAVVDMLFPGEKNGHIPLIAITGTNGKTTTARIIAHIAATAGYSPGLTTTDGIYINGNMIEEGDCTGPVSSTKVLQDSSVDFAVLECARGGLLRAGLAFNQCDVGIVTNVAEDHLGLRSIDTVEDMALVKSIIAETVKPDGVAILNADNNHTYQMRSRVKCRVALFSTNPKSDRIIQHSREGGMTAVIKEGKIIVMNGSRIIFREKIQNIPLAYEGKAVYMIENIMAAVLGALAAGIQADIIGEALRSFMPTFEALPGRTNLIPFKDFSFILDYAHNFHSITALGKLVNSFPSVCKVGIITAVGDRRDIDIINIGKVSAGLFDQIIIRVDEDTRNRNEQEIINLLYTGILQVNEKIPVEVVKKESDAVNYAITNAVSGSIIVLFSENLKSSYHIIQEYKNREDELLKQELLMEKNINYNYQ
jgi:cyanophycin synthetase